MQISIVVPVYNNFSTLPELTSSLIDLLPKYYDSFEILYIDDGSKVSSIYEQIHYVHAVASCPVRIIHLKRNYGQHFATLCGIFLSHGSEIITLDADMIQEVYFIPELSRHLKESNADVAYAVFDRRKKYGIGWKYLFSYLFLAVSRVSGIKHYSSFRAISSRVRPNIMQQRHRYFVIEGMLIESGCILAYCFLNTLPEKGNSSSYTFMKRILFTVSIIPEYFPIPFFTLLFIILNSVLVFADAILQILLAANAFLVSAVVCYLFYRIRAPITSEQINHSMINSGCTSNENRHSA